MKQGSTTTAFSYLVEKIDFVIPWPQNRVYKLSAQVTRLTTLCTELSIKIPTMWYIATLVPLGVQRILFLPGSSKGLKFINNTNIFAPKIVLNNKLIVIGRYRIRETE